MGLAKYHKSKIYQVNYDRIFAAACDVLSETKFEIIEIDKDKGLIKVKAPLSWKSYGENIEVHFYQMDIGVQIYIGSVGHQIYDWGKSKENVTNFFTTLDKHLEQDL